MVVIEQIQSHEGELQLFRGPPAQPDIKGQVRRNVGIVQAVHEPESAIEFHGTGDVGDGAEGKLLLGGAAFK